MLYWQEQQNLGRLVLKEQLQELDYDVLNGPVTALRGVSTSGAITIEVVR